MKKMGKRRKPTNHSIWSLTLSLLPFALMILLVPIFEINGLEEPVHLTQRQQQEGSFQRNQHGHPLLLDYEAESQQYSDQNGFQNQHFQPLDYEEASSQQYPDQNDFPNQHFQPLLDYEGALSQQYPDQNGFKNQHVHPIDYKGASSQQYANNNNQNENDEGEQAERKTEKAAADCHPMNLTSNSWIPYQSPHGGKPVPVHCHSGRDQVLLAADGRGRPAKEAGQGLIAVRCQNGYWMPIGRYSTMNCRSKIGMNPDNDNSPRFLTAATHKSVNPGCAILEQYSDAPNAAKSTENKKQIISPTQCAHACESTVSCLLWEWSPPDKCSMKSASVEPFQPFFNGRMGPTSGDVPVMEFLSGEEGKEVAVKRSRQLRSAVDGTSSNKKQSRRFKQGQPIKWAGNKDKMLPNGKPKPPPGYILSLEHGQPMLIPSGKTTPPHLNSSVLSQLNISSDSMNNLIRALTAVQANNGATTNNNAPPSDGDSQPGSGSNPSSSGGKQAAGSNTNGVLNANKVESNDFANILALLAPTTTTLHPPLGQESVIKSVTESTTKAGNDSSKDDAEHCHSRHEECEADGAGGERSCARQFFQCTQSHRCQRKFDRAVSSCPLRNSSKNDEDDEPPCRERAERRKHLCRKPAESIDCNDNSGADDDDDDEKEESDGKTTACKSRKKCQNDFMTAAGNCLLDDKGEKCRRKATKVKGKCLKKHKDHFKCSDGYMEKNSKCPKAAAGEACRQQAVRWHQICEKRKGCRKDLVGGMKNCDTGKNGEACRREVTARYTKCVNQQQQLQPNPNHAQGGDMAARKHPTPTTSNSDPCVAKLKTAFAACKRDNPDALDDYCKAKSKTGLTECQRNAKCTQAVNSLMAECKQQGMNEAGGDEALQCRMKALTFHDQCKKGTDNKRSPNNRQKTGPDCHGKFIAQAEQCKSTTNSNSSDSAVTACHAQALVALEKCVQTVGCDRKSVKAVELCQSQDKGPAAEHDCVGRVKLAHDKCVKSKTTKKHNDIDLCQTQFQKAEDKCKKKGTGTDRCQKFAIDQNARCQKTVKCETNYKAEIKTCTATEMTDEQCTKRAGSNREKCLEMVGKKRKKNQCFSKFLRMTKKCPNGAKENACRSDAHHWQSMCEKRRKCRRIHEQKVKNCENSVDTSNSKTTEDGGSQKEDLTSCNHKADRFLDHCQSSETDSEGVEEPTGCGERFQTAKEHCATTKGSSKICLIKAKTRRQTCQRNQQCRTRYFSSLMGCERKKVLKERLTCNDRVLQVHVKCSAKTGTKGSGEGLQCDRRFLEKTKKCGEEEEENESCRQAAIRWHHNCNRGRNCRVQLKKCEAIDAKDGTPETADKCKQEAKEKGGACASSKETKALTCNQKFLKQDKDCKHDSDPIQCQKKALERQETCEAGEECLEKLKSDRRKCNSAPKGKKSDCLRNVLKKTENCIASKKAGTDEKDCSKHKTAKKACKADDKKCRRKATAKLDACESHQKCLEQYAEKQEACKRKPLDSKKTSDTTDTCRKKAKEWRKKTCNKQGKKKSDKSDSSSSKQDAECDRTMKTAIKSCSQEREGKQCRAKALKTNERCHELADCAQRFKRRKREKCDKAHKKGGYARNKCIRKENRWLDSCKKGNKENNCDQKYLHMIKLCKIGPTGEPCREKALKWQQKCAARKKCRSEYHKKLTACTSYDGVDKTKCEKKAEDWRSDCVNGNTKEKCRYKYLDKLRKCPKTGSSSSTDNNTCRKKALEWKQDCKTNEKCEETYEKRQRVCRKRPNEVKRIHCEEAALKEKRVCVTGEEASECGRAFEAANKKCPAAGSGDGNDCRAKASSAQQTCLRRDTCRRQQNQDRQKCKQKIEVAVDRTECQLKADQDAKMCERLSTEKSCTEHFVELTQKCTIGQEGDGCRKNAVQRQQTCEKKRICQEKFTKEVQDCDKKLKGKRTACQEQAYERRKKCQRSNTCTAEYTDKIKQCKVGEAGDMCRDRATDEQEDCEKKEQCRVTRGKQIKSCRKLQVSSHVRKQCRVSVRQSHLQCVSGKRVTKCDQAFQKTFQKCWKRAGADGRKKCQKTARADRKTCTATHRAAHAARADKEQKCQAKHRTDKTQCDSEATDERKTDCRKRSHKLFQACMKKDRELNRLLKKQKKDAEDEKKKLKKEQKNPEEKNKEEKSEVDKDADDKNEDKTDQERRANRKDKRDRIRSKRRRKTNRGDEKDREKTNRQNDVDQKDDDQKDGAKDDDKKDGDDNDEGKNDDADKDKNDDADKDKNDDAAKDKNDDADKDKDQKGEKNKKQSGGKKKRSSDQKDKNDRNTDRKEDKEDRKRDNSSNDSSKGSQSKNRQKKKNDNKNDDDQEDSKSTQKNKRQQGRRSDDDDDDKKQKSNTDQDNNKEGHLVDEDDEDHLQESNTSYTHKENDDDDDKNESNTDNEKSDSEIRDNDPHLHKHFVSHNIDDDVDDGDEEQKESNIREEEYETVNEDPRDTNNKKQKNTNNNKWSDSMFETSAVSDDADDEDDDSARSSKKHLTQQEEAPQSVNVLKERDHNETASTTSSSTTATESSILTATKTEKISALADTETTTPWYYTFTGPRKRRRFKSSSQADLPVEYRVGQQHQQQQQQQQLLAGNGHHRNDAKTDIFTHDTNQKEPIVHPRPPPPPPPSIPPAMIEEIHLPELAPSMNRIPSPPLSVARPPKLKRRRRTKVKDHKKPSRRRQPTKTKLRKKKPRLHHHPPRPQPRPRHITPVLPGLSDSLPSETPTATTTTTEESTTTTTEEPIPETTETADKKPSRSTSFTTTTDLPRGHVFYHDPFGDLKPITESDFPSSTSSTRTTTTPLLQLITTVDPRLGDLNDRLYQNEYNMATIKLGEGLSDVHRLHDLRRLHDDGSGSGDSGGDEGDDGVGEQLSNDTDTSINPTAGGVTTPSSDTTAADARASTTQQSSGGATTASGKSGGKGKAKEGDGKGNGGGEGATTQSSVEDVTLEQPPTTYSSAGNGPLTTMESVTTGTSFPTMTTADSSSGPPLSSTPLSRQPSTPASEGKSSPSETSSASDKGGSTQPGPTTITTGKSSGTGGHGVRLQDPQQPAQKYRVIIRPLRKIRKGFFDRPVYVYETQDMMNPSQAFPQPEKQQQPNVHELEQVAASFNNPHQALAHVAEQNEEVGRDAKVDSDESHGGHGDAEQRQGYLQWQAASKMTAADERLPALPKSPGKRMITNANDKKATDENEQDQINQRGALGQSMTQQQQENNGENDGIDPAFTADNEAAAKLSSDDNKSPTTSPALSGGNKGQHDGSPQDQERRRNAQFLTHSEHQQPVPSAFEYLLKLQAVNNQQQQSSADLENYRNRNLHFLQGGSNTFFGSYQPSVMSTTSSSSSGQSNGLLSLQQRQARNRRFLEAGMSRVDLNGNDEKKVSLAGQNSTFSAHHLQTGF